MKAIKLIILFVLCISFIKCGNDSFEEGKTAYIYNNYTQAIKHLTKVKDKNLKDTEYFEMLAIAYMHHGASLYERTQNLDIYSGNYKKSQSVLPKKSSAKFKKEYSKLLLSLSECYIKNATENNQQKEKYFKYAINILNQSIEFDDTNINAKELLVKVKADHFKYLLEEANRFYTIAEKQQRLNLYFTSKHYLDQAAEYVPEHNKISNLQRKIRKQLLSVLDDRDGVALAVTDYIIEDDQLKMMLAVENYLDSAIQINPHNLRLVDQKGNTYEIDKKGMEFYEFLGKKCLKKTQLDHTKSYVDGIVIFSIPANVRIDYLSYMVNNEEITRKYF